MVAYGHVEYNRRIAPQRAINPERGRPYTVQCRLAPLSEVDHQAKPMVQGPTIEGGQPPRDFGTVNTEQGQPRTMHHKFIVEVVLGVPQKEW